MSHWLDSLDRAESSADKAWEVLRAFAQLMKEREPVPPQLRDYVIEAIEAAVSSDPNDKSGNDQRASVLLQKLNVHAKRRRPKYKKDFLREANESWDAKGDCVSYTPSEAAKLLARSHGLKASSARKFLEADRAASEAPSHYSAAYDGFRVVGSVVDTLLPQITALVAAGHATARNDSLEVRCTDACAVAIVQARASLQS